jgi:hypothetical protein
MPKGRLRLGEQSDGNRKSESEYLWTYVRLPQVAPIPAKDCSGPATTIYHWPIQATTLHISLHTVDQQLRLVS